MGSRRWLNGVKVTLKQRERKSVKEEGLKWAEQRVVGCNESEQNGG